MTRRGAIAGLIVAAGCAAPSAPPPATTQAAPASAGAVGLPAFVPKARFLPDVESGTAEEARRIVGRLRIATYPDGSVRRARQLLPVGRLVASALPERLGGGHAFVSVGGRGTELWRASGWLDDLEPVGSFPSVADADEPIVAGFDRLYVRMRTNNDLVPVHPVRGLLGSRGALPRAPAIGELAFADPWRAVADTDALGPLATFDGGATWHPLPVEGRVRDVTIGAEGDPRVVTDRATYQVGARGEVRRLAPPSGDALLGPARGAPATRPPPAGRRPLRAALERGYPDGPGTAVLAHEGALVRVSLEDGRPLHVAPGALPDAACQAIALGSPARPADAFGFVCGRAAGETTIHAFERPLGAREVMRFATPRRVVENGRGAIVVHGPCGDEPAAAETRPFCVRAADGATREIRVRGAASAERVIALQDGRVAILVPPRLGAQGQVSILAGDEATHRVLALPAEPADARRLLELGMWQDGMVEIAPGVLAGFVEGGGPVAGVRVTLATGEVEVGELVDEPGGVVTGGRFAFALGERGTARETTDAGQTWTEIETPLAPDESTRVALRRCGPVGCVLPGWLRVGWAEAAVEDDLAEAGAPRPGRLDDVRLASGGPSLACEVARRRPSPRPAPSRAKGESPTGWQPFRDVAPPELAQDAIGLDAGAPFEAVPMRAYVWGPKDADWARAGSMLVRFSDRFALDDVRSSAVTVSPWGSRELASEALGIGAYGYSITWSAARDPGGDAALAGACRGRSCALFAVDPGRPLAALRAEDPQGAPRPYAGSSVRLGATWYFLGDTGQPDGLGLYRVDGSLVRRVVVWPRLATPRFAPAQLPQLVRRASGSGLGLTFVSKDGPGDRVGDRYVLPVDPETGALGEAIDLGRADLADTALEAGCGRRDGWLLELGSLDGAEVLVGGARAPLDSLELRMRLEPRVGCVEAGQATLQLPAAPRAGAPKRPTASAPTLPLIASVRGSTERVELRCALATERRVPILGGALEVTVPAPAAR